MKTGNVVAPLAGSESGGLIARPPLFYYTVQNLNRKKQIITIFGSVKTPVLYQTHVTFY